MPGFMSHLSNMPAMLISDRLTLLLKTLATRSVFAAKLPLTCLPQNHHNERLK